MKNALLMLTVVTSGVLLSALENSLVKKNIRSVCDNFAYVFIVYLFGALIMYLNGGRFQCSSFTKIMGIITGFTIIGEAVCGVGALKNGPMSLTNMLSMSSMVIPMIPAGILWNEPMTGVQIFAAALMLLAMSLILNMYGKKEEGKGVFSGVNPRWLVFGLGCFLFGGLMGFPQKYQTMSAFSGEIMSYLLYAFLTATFLSVLCILFFSRKKGESLTLKFSAKLALEFAGCGILTAYLHILTMEALNRIPIAIVLTVSNGGRLILVTLVDMFYFKQKLTAQQIIGIAVGIVSILLLSI